MARADDLAEAILLYVEAIPGDDPKDPEAVRLAVAQAIVDYTVGEDDLPPTFDDWTPGWPTGELTVNGTVLVDVVPGRSWVYRFSNSTTLVEIQPAGTFNKTADHGTNQRWEDALREAPRLVVSLPIHARPKLAETLSIQVDCTVDNLTDTTAGKGAVIVGFLCHHSNSIAGFGWVGVQLVKEGASTREVRGVFNDGANDDVFTSDSVSPLWFTVGSTIGLTWAADNVFTVYAKQELDEEYTTVGSGVLPEAYPVAVFMAIAHDAALDPETPEVEFHATNLRILKAGQ